MFPTKPGAPGDKGGKSARLALVLKGLKSASAGKPKKTAFSDKDGDE